MSRFINKVRSESKKRLSLQVENLETRLVPASFSLNQFEQNIRDTFENNTIGYAYSINYNGQIAIRHDGAGMARTDADSSPKAFTEDTRMTVASVGKPITAAAILKILQDQGMSIDTKIEPYLPASWVRGPNIDTITFHELLTHQSGIRRGFDFDGNGSVQYADDVEYDGLRGMIAQGISLSNKPDDVYTSGPDTEVYENANFALMRVMLPYLWDGADNEDYDDANDPAEKTAEAYVEYVQNNIFEPMGITGANTDNPSKPTLSYSFPAVNDQKGFNWGDRTLVSGGEGWYLSTDELATFLHHMHYENTVLNAQFRYLMREYHLGWMDPTEWSHASGIFGDYHGHGGDLFTTETNVRDLNTSVVSFPTNGLQIAFMTNSQIGANTPHAAAYTNFRQGRMLKSAYENAWPEMDINGTAGADTFTLRRNANDSQVVDIILDTNSGQVVTRRWLETLDQLTFNGYGGNDTFIIEDMPTAFKLILNGGSGDDEFRFGDDGNDYFVYGDVSVFGGTGVDSIIINNQNTAFESHYTLTNYTIDSNYNAYQFKYYSVSDISIFAGNNHDTLTVENTATDANILFYGGAGNDTVTVGSGDLITNFHGSLIMYGQGGSDKLVINDKFASSGKDVHYVNAGSYSKFGVPGTIQNNSVESIVLDTGYVSNKVMVNNTSDGQNVVINTRAGADDVTVHRIGLASDVTINTGSGNDIVRLTPTGLDLDEIYGNLVINTGNGSGDELHMFDQNDWNPDAYVIDHTHLSKDTIADIIYNQVENIHLWTNENSNFIEVNSLSADMELTIHAGNGNDTVSVGHKNADLDTHLHGKLNLIGQGGNDRLEFHDSNDQYGDDTYSLDFTTFSKTGTQSWYFSGFEDVELNANKFDNNIDVSRFGSLLDTRTLTIHGNYGDDNLTLGAGINRADLIFADVTFIGSNGKDTVTISDQNASYGHEYVLTQDTFDMDNTLFGSLYFQTVDDIVVNGTVHDDIFRVHSSTVSTDVELNGNAGNDNVYVTPDNRDLDYIGGSLKIQGGSGSNSLFVYDNMDKGNDNYTISSPSLFTGSITKSNFDMSYNGFSWVTLNANQDQNIVRVESTPLFGNLEVNANGGNDIIRISPSEKLLSATQSFVFVNGGDGQDRLELFDQNAKVESPYTVTNSQVKRDGAWPVGYGKMENVILHLNEDGNKVDVLSTNEDTELVVHGNGGNDTVSVTAPTSTVILLGGEGVDTAELIAGSGHDKIVIQGDTMQLNGGQVIGGKSVEQRKVHGHKGQNVVQLLGAEGIDELFRIKADTSPNAGEIQSNAFSPVEFEYVQEIDVIGNEDDFDRLVFDGTNKTDVFDINLAAKGATEDPVLTLSRSDETKLLTLRNFANVGTPQINGLDGADTFTVNVGPDGNRDIRVNGNGEAGSDTGDLLVINYKEEENSLHDWIIEKPTTGIVQFDNGNSLVSVEYGDMETVDLLTI